MEHCEKPMLHAMVTIVTELSKQFLWEYTAKDIIHTKCTSTNVRNGNCSNYIGTYKYEDENNNQQSDSTLNHTKWGEGVVTMITPDLWLKATGNS